jgi:hypothetical protein
MRPRSFLLEDETIPINHAADILCTLRTVAGQYFIDTSSEVVYNLCMMPIMAKEADLNRIDVPEER